MAALLLSACNGGVRDTGDRPRREAADAGYSAPPEITGVQPSGGRVTLTGKAAPGATVRVATPQGGATEAAVDAQGTWRLAVPATPQGGLYALSQRFGGRAIQAQGYVLVTPQGDGALLRAGAGAIKLGPKLPLSGVTALDFDRAGAAVVSGRGPAGGAISARLDGKKVGESRIDPQGRFAIALLAPLEPGPHSIKVFGDSVDSSLTVDASRAAPLTTGPIRATPTGAGLRVDWMTPGGGVQSTVLAP
jgi:hypothetical protein